MKKTVSFAAIHMCVAFSVGYLMTGDVMVGGALALVEPLCNTVAYYFHEKLWARKSAAQTAKIAGAGKGKVRPAFSAMATS